MFGTFTKIKEVNTNIGNLYELLDTLEVEFKLEFELDALLVSRMLNIADDTSNKNRFYINNLIIASSIVSGSLSKDKTIYAEDENNLMHSLESHLLLNIDKHNKLVKNNYRKNKTPRSKSRMLELKISDKSSVVILNYGLMLICDSDDVRTVIDVKPTLHKNGNKFVTPSGFILHRLLVLEEIEALGYVIEVHHANVVTSDIRKGNLWLLTPEEHKDVHRNLRLHSKKGVKIYE